MNSLLSYGSDDDLNDSADESYSVEPHGAPPRSYRKPVGPKQDDTNYDEVQMSLSEDSDAETNSNRKSKDDRAPSRDRDVSRTNACTRDSRYKRNDDRSNRSEDKYGKDDDRAKYRDDKEDRNRSRDDDRNRDRCSADRDDDRTNRDRRARSKDRDRYRDDRYNRDRRDRDRRRSRSRSRDRRRSRSPRRDRSRSRSRDRGGGRGYYRKIDRPNRDRFEDRNNSKSNVAQSVVDETQAKDRFFMPGITGRFREQIEKRKLLWQKGKEMEKVVDNRPVAAAVPLGTSSKTTKVWETTTFAQDSDGKVANKFKRLMGIKTPTDGNKVATEVLKKQEEMFSSMEAQYEVARTATHTMRGVGLGFGSYQR